MSVLDTYKARMEIHGVTKRERAIHRAQSYITKKAEGAVSTETVLIDNAIQKVTILHKSEDVNIKKICSMPGETLQHGGIVDFADAKWLITDLDADDKVYANGIMQRCNYILKWLNNDGRIVKRWCIVEDGTKYLVGERSGDIITVGDARIAITIGKDAETTQLRRGKRFLVDDPMSNDVLAYQISKPNKLFNIYGGNGVFKFILTEVSLTDADNTELRIADYYNWQPDKKLDKNHTNPKIPLEDIIYKAPDANDDDGKKVWL